jgi:hypothetical protein
VGAAPSLRLEATSHFPFSGMSRSLDAGGNGLTDVDRTWVSLLIIHLRIDWLIDLWHESPEVVVRSNGVRSASIMAHAQYGLVQISPPAANKLPVHAVSLPKSVCRYHCAASCPDNDFDDPPSNTVLDHIRCRGRPIHAESSRCGPSSVRFEVTIDPMHSRAKASFLTTVQPAQGVLSSSVARSTVALSKALLLDLEAHIRDHDEVQVAIDVLDLVGVRKRGRGQGADNVINRCCWRQKRRIQSMVRE